jgi:hypothetical protein
MKNKVNLSNLLYNKYSFYHNEWYSNMYYYDKNKNVYNILHVEFIYTLLNMYFNKINTFNKKVLNKINAINLTNTLTNINFNNIKNSINNINIYNNIISTYTKNSKLYKNLVNKIYFNIIEIKYYSNKVVIHICVYNREKLVILRKLKLLKIKNAKEISFNTNLENNTNFLLKEKLNLLNNKLFLYRYYTSKLFLNNLKFNTHSLLKLKKILFGIFNKKVLFNITNIKYFHLNNSILLDSISGKLNNNRKSSILKLIRKGLRFAKTAKLHFLLKVKKLDTGILKEMKDTYKNILDIKSDTKVAENVFSKGVNMHVVGLRLEARGRLTKRLVASRAINKFKYKGSLNNVYSSVNKNSVITFKGHEKSNINYSNKNSYNVLGSYGIKYWVSSY